MKILSLAARNPAFQSAASRDLGFCLWFFGFVVIGGEYFAMWQSKLWNGQDAAFRIATTMLAALIFISLPDGELA